MEPGTDEVRRAVESYQIARMRRTHEEMLRTPPYAPLCEFFLTDLYASREVGSRGAAAFARMAPLLRRILPGWMYDGATSVVALHALSEGLDARLAQVLVSRGSSAGFTEGEFEAAYFACDDRPERLRQIDLAEAALNFAFALSRDTKVASLLLAARRLPNVGGSSLLGVLERGYEVFRSAATIEPLVEDMRVGEVAYLTSIYARFSKAAEGSDPGGLML